MSTSSGYDLTPYPAVDETENEATAPDGHVGTAHTDCTEAVTAMQAHAADPSIPATAQTREALDRALLPVDTGHNSLDTDRQTRALWGRVMHPATSIAAVFAILDAHPGAVAGVNGWYINADLTRARHRIAIGPRLGPDAYVRRDPMTGRADVVTRSLIEHGDGARWGGCETPIGDLIAPRYVLAGEWEADMGLDLAKAVPLAVAKVTKPGQLRSMVGPEVRDNWSWPSPLRCYGYADTAKTLVIVAVAFSGGGAVVPATFPAANVALSFPALDAANARLAAYQTWLGQAPK